MRIEKRKKNDEIDESSKIERMINHQASFWDILYDDLLSNLRTECVEWIWIIGIALIFSNILIFEVHELVETLPFRTV